MPKSGFEKFQGDLLDSVSDLMRSKSTIEQVAAAYPTVDDLLEGRQIVKHAPQLTREERFLLDVLADFTEVTETMEVIRDTKVFMSRFPFRNTRVSRPRYLAHQISVHMQEIYIMRVRLVKLAQTVKNGLSKTPHKSAAETHVNPLFKIIRQSFDGIETTRGIHVHNRRYSDGKLRKVSTLDLLGRNGYPPAAALVDSAFRETRSTWVRTVALNIEALDQLLDVYSKALWMTLFAPGRQYDIEQLRSRQQVTKSSG